MKAVIKMRTVALVASVLSSTSNCDLCTKLLVSIICTHNLKSMHKKKSLDPGPGTPSSSRCTPNLRVCLTSKLASRQAVMVLEEGAHGEQGAVLGSSSARSSTGRRADPSRSRKDPPLGCTFSPLGPHG